MLAPTSHAHVQDSRHARLGLPRENVHLPDGLAEDSEAIRALGGLDLQLLGITLRGLTKRRDKPRHFRPRKDSADAEGVL